jgi:hypothetical protein
MAPRASYPNFFPDSNESFQGLISTLRGYTQDREDRRRFELQEARQRAGEDFTRRQSEVAERRAAEAERRQGVTERQAYADRRSRRAQQIADLARQGRTTEAQALARAGRDVNPDTGEDESIQFDPGGESFDPGFKPLQLDEPTMQAPARGPAALYGGRFSAPAAGMGPTAPRAPLEQPAGADDGATEPPPLDQQNGAPAARPPRTGLRALNIGQPPPEIDTTQGKLTRRNPARVMPGGERVEFDPAEGQRYRLQEAQDTADRLITQASQETDPAQRRAMLAEAQRIRASIPGASAAGLRTEALQQNAQAFKAAEADKHDMTAEQKFKIGMRPKAAGAAGAPNLKNDTANRQDLGLLEKHMVNMERSVGFKALDGQNKALQIARANFEGDDPARALARRDAMMNLAAVARGGAKPTDSEMHFLYHNLGGRLGNAIPHFIEDLDSGDLTPKEKAAFHEALKSAEDEAHKFMENAAKSLRTSLGHGSGYEGMQTNANVAFRARMQELGFPDEAIVEPFPGATSGVTLGSGKRPRLPPAGSAVPPAVAGGPAEGATKTTSSGRTFVFTGGQWRAQRNGP